VSSNSSESHPAQRVTPAMEDYLKAIYKLQVDPAVEAVTTSVLAERLSVSAPSTTKMVKKLSELKLVAYVPYRGVELTFAGERIALETIRHHRLLERYLADVLGFSWDQVDAEADRLEHVISEEFENRIDKALGFPTTDPHGAPIPGRTGTVEETACLRLSEVPVGATAVVERVSDRDPEMLRYMDSLGLRPGVIVCLKDRAPFGGGVRIRIDSVDSDMEHAIGTEVARSIHVTRPD